MTVSGNYICGSILIIWFVAICSANRFNEEGGFLNVTCDKAQDCYVDFDAGLALSCWSTVNKCKCSNTFSSKFYLKWENNQCLMSKYGPCGKNGEDLVVGCQDGFVCVDNQCRDPADTSAKAVKIVAFPFEDSDCFRGDCTFSEELRLECDHSQKHCQCAKVYVADAPDTLWDIRNYDGDKNCSVAQFGPCGTRNGIKIECHGDGITCVDGVCLKENHLLSDVGEDCQSTKNCKEGLLCSSDYVCIEPFSVPENKSCSSDDDCQKGLQCRRSGPFSSAFCVKIDDVKV